MLEVCYDTQELVFAREVKPLEDQSVTIRFVERSAACPKKGRIRWCWEESLARLHLPAKSRLTHHFFNHRVRVVVFYKVKSEERSIIKGLVK
jgi:hypothetical protein